MTKVSMAQLDRLIARADELTAQGKHVIISMDVLEDTKVTKDQWSSAPTYMRDYE
jgi:hypothetical protein